PEGGAVTSAPLGWALDRWPHPHAHQVIKGRVCLCLSSPWLTPSFERTGRSPLRTVLATFMAHGSPPYIRACLTSGSLPAWSLSWHSTHNTSVLRFRAIISRCHVCVPCLIFASFL